MLAPSTKRAPSSPIFVRNVDRLIQNDSNTYVTIMKLNNWDALTSETEVKKTLKTRSVYFQLISPPCIA